MTGLMMKDALVMRKTLRLYALFLLFYSGLAVLGVFPMSMALAMVEVIVMVLPISSFSYDEAAKWDRYAAVLPVGRTAVVKARYLFLLLVLLAAAVLCGIFFLWFLPSYGQEVQQADPEFTWAYWPCLIWAWLFALPIFGAMLPCWRIFGSISAPEGAFTRRNARDMRSISRLAFADALIFPAGMFVLAFMGAGSAPLTIIITPMVIFCCAAVGIVCYVLSRLIGDAAALREENDMTI